MAVGPSGTVLSSTDGTTWGMQTISGNPTLEDVIYSGGKWIIVGDGGTVYTSTDGTSWTSEVSGTSGDIYGLASNGTLNVAAALNGDVTRSTDGISWTKINLAASLFAVEYGNGQFVMVGNQGKVFTSPDGVSWTSRASGTTNSLNRVIYGNNLFVVVGQVGTSYTTGFILTSPDGITWTPRTIPSGTGPLSGVIYAGGQFIAAGYGGNLISSPDGVNWTSESSVTSNDFYDVANGGNKSAAVGMAGTIVTRSYTTLPLTWLSFTALQKNNRVELQWSTASELQAADFVVQHSTDGFHWEDLGTLPAAAYSSALQTYSFIHSSPADGTNQYRLIERDLDGKKQYSKVIGVVIRLAGGFSIVENPVNNNLRLQISHKTREDFMLQIADITGKVIKEQKINGGIDFYTLNVGDLARGQYLLMLSSGSWKQVKRFIRQ